MRKIILALLAALLPSIAAAQVPFPQTLPANTVYGRLGISAGPGQAVPFAILTNNLLTFISSSDPLAVLNDRSAVIGNQLTFWYPTAFGPVATGKVHRLNRLLVGAATLGSSDAPMATKDWLETLLPSTTQNATLSATSPLGMLGIVGAARTQDFRTWAGSSTGGAQGVTGAALNNDSTGDAVACGVCAVAMRATGALGATINQYDTNNAGSVVDVTPFVPTPAGRSFSMLATAGAYPALATANVSAGLMVGPGATTKFRKGIVYDNLALDAAVGAGTNGVAIEMARNQSLRWQNSGPGTDAEMWANASGLTLSPALGVASGGQGNATLTSNGILVGNGTGAVISNRCTMDSNQSVSCTSASAFQPQFSFTNTTADANSAFFLFKKNRSGGVTNTNDSLGSLTFQGFANSAQQNTASVASLQTAAAVGSNIPSSVRLSTSNAAGQLNQVLTFDSAAHVATAQATAPTITAGCTGAGSSVGAGSSDLHGNITGSTAAATTCTITFGTAFSNTPSCVTSGDQSAILTQVRSTTTLVVTFASTANYRFNWICAGT